MKGRHLAREEMHYGRKRSKGKGCGWEKERDDVIEEEEEVTYDEGGMEEEGGDEEGR